jgi:hypothetical protein
VPDRLIIAALLAQLPECDSTAGESKITRNILPHLGQVPPTLGLANHLGLVYLEPRRYPEAARLRKLAHVGLAKACGEDDHTTIIAERALSSTYLTQWELLKAHKAAHRVRE